MKQTSQKFPVVMSSLSAMLLVALLESISGIRKKSISTHSTHLGGDREDTVYEYQETTKKELSQKHEYQSYITSTALP